MKATLAAQCADWICWWSLSYKTRLYLQHTIK